VEFDCAPDEESMLLDTGAATAPRVRVGRRLMLYLPNVTALAARVRQVDPHDARSLVVRPTNLEDVFLRLTGTNLEGTV
jgi:hypothetical protein